MQPDDRLDAWGVCHELAVAVYRATSAWPPAELHGLAAQVRRAAFNAALYVADDPPVRDVERRRLRLGQGLASLAQVGYALLLAHELRFLSVDEWQSIDQLRNRAEALIRALVSLAGAPPRLLQ